MHYISILYTFEVYLKTYRKSNKDYIKSARSLKVGINQTIIIFEVIYTIARCLSLSIEIFSKTNIFASCVREDI